MAQGGIDKATASGTKGGLGRRRSRGSAGHGRGGDRVPIPRPAARQGVAFGDEGENRIGGHVAQSRAPSSAGVHFQQQQIGPPPACGAAAASIASRRGSWICNGADQHDLRPAPPAGAKIRALGMGDAGDRPGRTGAHVVRSSSRSESGCARARARRRAGRVANQPGQGARTGRRTGTSLVDVRRAAGSGPGRPVSSREAPHPAPSGPGRAGMVGRLRGQARRQSGIAGADPDATEDARGIGSPAARGHGPRAESRRRRERSSRCDRAAPGPGFSPAGRDARAPGEERRCRTGDAWIWS